MRPWLEKCHPATEHLFLVNNSIFIPVLTVLYVFIVLKWGPTFMQNRKPYNIKGLLLIYNFIQVIANLHLLILIFFFLYNEQPYNWGCMTQMPLNHPQKHVEVNLGFGYFLLKILDLLDTIFFVLRKSFRQITFLHVFHHMFMLVGGFLYLRFQGPGGQVIVMGILNTFIHVIMYGYYFYTALYTNKKASIWWKKHLTQLQIFQFATVFLHHLYPLKFVPDCQLDKAWLYGGVVFSPVMGIMFANFYYRTYIKVTPKTEIELKDCVRGEVEMRQLTADPCADTVRFRLREID